MQRTFVIMGLLFVVGALIASMLTFLVVMLASDGASIGILRAWFAPGLTHYWWPWSLGGGLIGSLGYLAVRLARDDLE